VNDTRGPARSRTRSAACLTNSARY
jgi:hypothetical protein